MHGVVMFFRGGVSDVQFMIGVVTVRGEAEIDHCGVNVVEERREKGEERDHTSMRMVR